MIDNTAIYAYAAGVIDSDGCIGAYNTRPKLDTRSAHFQVTVRVAMYDDRVIDFFKDNFPEGTTHQENRKTTRKPVLVWQARNKKAEEFLTKILPYLVGKRDQADLVLEFCELRRETKANHKSGVRYPKEILDMYQGRVDALKALKV